MSEKTEFVLIVGAGILVASLLDGMLASVLNPIFTSLKLAPYGS